MKSITPKKHFIYTLCDPISDEPFYVGQSTNLRQRFNMHMFQSRHGHTADVCNVIRALIENGDKPICKTIDEIVTSHHDLVLKLEALWKWKLSMEGRILVNMRNDNFVNRGHDINGSIVQVKALAFAPIGEVESFFSLEIKLLITHAA